MEQQNTCVYCGVRPATPSREVKFSDHGIRYVFTKDSFSCDVCPRKSFRGLLREYGDRLVLPAGKKVGEFDIAWSHLVNAEKLANQKEAGRVEARQLRVLLDILVALRVISPVRVMSRDGTVPVVCLRDGSDATFYFTGRKYASDYARHRFSSNTPGEAA